MAIQTVPSRYKTSDGREFGNETDAQRHELLIAAKRKYEDARHEYARALAESQRTADGQPFNLSGMHDYYYITDGYFSMPEIVRVDFWYWNCDINEADETVIVVLDSQKATRREYRISSLYYWKGNARKALLIAQEGRLAQITQDVEQLRQELTKGED